MFLIYPISGHFHCLISCHQLARHQRSIAHVQESRTVLTSRLEMLNNTTYPLIEPGFILAVKITAGTTCILSILGSCLIIFSYVVLVDLRTAARQLLVNLSIADIIVTLSHLIGLFVNFERFIPHYNPETWNSSTIDPVCISQAAFTLFGSISSFLWSMAIALYLIMLTTCKRPNLMKKITLPVLYIVCWGIPAIMIIPNAVKHYFGFALAADIGKMCT